MYNSDANQGSGVVLGKNGSSGNWYFDVIYIYVSVLNI